MTIAFGTHYLLTIKQGERKRVRAFYQGALGCELQAHDHGVTANIPPNLDLFHFPGGVVLGVAYVDDKTPTLGSKEQRLACWLEIKTAAVEALVAKLKQLGVEEITDFWDKDHFYFHAPGGQIFRIVALGS